MAALEPEIKIIVNNHKSTLSQIEKEEEKKRDRMRQELKAEYEGQVDLCRVQANAKYNEKIRESQIRWNDRMAALHDEHTLQMAKVRDQLFVEREAQRRTRADRLAQLTDRRSRELLRAEKDARMFDLLREHEKEQMNLQLKYQQEAMQNDKEMSVLWKSEQRKEIARERALRLKDEEIKLSKHQKGEVETIIRRIQQKEILKIKEIQLEKAKRERLLQAERDSSLKRINDETQAHQDMLSEAARDVECYQEEMKALREELERIQKSNNEYKHIQLKREGVLSDCDERIRRARERSNMLTEETRAKEHSHNMRIKTLKRDHEMKLDELDMKGRKDIEALDKQMVGASAEIEDENTRIEHLQTMVLRYTEENQGRKEEEAPVQIMCNGNTDKGVACKTLSMQKRVAKTVRLSSRKVLKSRNK